MWLTTKDGRHFNTDWIDKDRQIEANKKEAEKLNHESKRPKRLTSNDDPEKLREELKSKLINKDSYLNDPEYQRLSDATLTAFDEYQKLKARRSELWEIEKKGSTVDEETLKEFGGDRQLAQLFANKDDKAKAAESELKELRGKIDKAQEKWDVAGEKLKAYETPMHKTQKEAFKQSPQTLSTDVKKDYEGFELDTHTSHYQQLLKNGEAMIVEMSPKEYLIRCGVDIFDSTYEKQVRAILADAKHTYDLADKISNGVKMYMPMLNYEEKEQEGRHRAAAAVLNGISRIPVLVVPKKRR